jgi:hypothetical protein
MNSHQMALALSLGLALFACSRQGDQATTETTTEPTPNISAGLSESLTFHASFDHGPNADFGSGDLKIYSIDSRSKEISEGIGTPPQKLDTTSGKFNSALSFNKENTHTVFYKVENNITYSSESFKGTFSFWLSTDPQEIPGQYCDPVQITDKDYSNAAIWVDITKNDSPSDLRLGVFGDQPVWDVSNKKGEAEEFFWRLHKVAEPPLGKGEWTHIVITWDGVNTKQGRAKLYLNGEYKGSSSLIREPFTWDVANVRLNLGIGYVGLFDDIAAFNKALSPDEIRSLHNLDNGVAELYKK